jgi:uncharacterized protein
VSAQRPLPFDPGIGRYVPDCPWPSRRYVPGLGFRPPSVQHKSVQCSVNPGVLSVAMWQHNGSYLWGADLFNFSYWWEAHEAWEKLWLPAVPPLSTYLQGLIQTAAGLLKWQVGNRRGQESLLDKGQAKLVEVAKISPRYMGLDLEDFVGRLEAFRILGARPGEAVPAAVAPVLRLG